MENNKDSIFIKDYKTMSYYMRSGIVEMVKHPDNSFDIVYVNEAAANLLCNADDEVAVQRLYEDPYAFVYPADKSRVVEAVLSCRQKDNVSETYRVFDKAGNIVWVLAHFHSTFVGDDLHIIIVYTNVDELMGAQVRLQSEGDKLLDIVNSIPMGIAIFEIDAGGKSTVLSLNDQMVTFANDIGNYLDGNSRHWQKEELIMLFNQSVYAFCAKSDTYIVANMLEESKIFGTSSCIFKLRGSTEKKPVFVKSTCFSKPSTDNKRNYYITFENVTKDKLQEMELEEKQDMLLTMSYYDALTHVKNRNSYNVFLKNVKRFPLKNVGIVFADLNGLKKVNDVLGHQYGDDMIVRFANILSNSFDSSSVFRISGDEFVVIWANITREEFVAKMERLIHEVEANDNCASLGYVWEAEIRDLKQTTSKAEQIMYVEKQRYYELEKSLQSKHRPLLLNSIISDFENRRFKMFLQPKADVKSSKIIGAEALVRKIDETGRVVLPYEFIPQLEKERLIPKIDFYMLEEACIFLEGLKKEGKTDFKVSVNMSRVTLIEHNYIESVKRIIGKYDFNTSQLEFEITESTETMDPQRFEECIKAIKSLGISISLDDMGTDYSSLTMLLLDGIDCVKLDRSLVTQIKTPKASKLLQHVTNLCHDFGMEVIAEGVENDDTRGDLEGINCDSYQGYLLSKPIPVDDFRIKFFKDKRTDK